MKAISLVLCLIFFGCVSSGVIIDYGSNSLEAKAAIETSIRNQVKKPKDPLNLPDLDKVERLSIRSSNITDLRFLSDLKQIRKLELGNNKISDLSPLASLSRLEELELRGNMIVVLSPLAALSQLKSLSLQENPELTMSKITELQKVLPSCKIYTDIQK